MLGPPAQPKKIWTVYKDRLYMNADHSVDSKWKQKLDADIATVDAKWIGWYGQLNAGPFNNHCYTRCYATGTCPCFIKPQPMPPKVPPAVEVD